MVGVIAASLYLGACHPPPSANQNEMNDHTIGDIGQALAQVSGMKVYFGHQSVGNNILSGIEQLNASGGTRPVQIAEGTDIGQFSGGILLHSQLGINGDPLSKLREFQAMLNQGIGAAADIAILKFCYLDFDSTTDAEAVFSVYKQTMLELQADYENLTIVHSTVPLQINPEGFKTRIKKLLGKTDLWEYQANIKRTEFNRMLLAEFSGKEPVFDIAEVESTTPGGARITFEFGGTEYYALAPEYTNDGSHLNAPGQRRAAERFVEVLASVTN